MPSRRTIDRCTDSRLTLSDDEVQEVHRLVAASGSADRSITVGVLIGVPMIILIGTGGGYLLLSMLQTLGLTRGQALWVCGIGLPLALIAAWLWAFGRLYRRLVRRALVRCGHPVCVGCGYVLDGVEGAVCPECGRRIEGG